MRVDTPRRRTRRGPRGQSRSETAIASSPFVAAAVRRRPVRDRSAYAPASRGSTARAGSHFSTPTTATNTIAAATSDARCRPPMKLWCAALMICGTDTGRARSRLAHDADRAPDRVARGGDDRQPAPCPPARREMRAVVRREDRAEHRDADRAADLAGRVVHRRSDARLLARQRAHDRLGRGRHDVAHADAHDDRHEDDVDRARADVEGDEADERDRDERQARTRRRPCCRTARPSGG